jgi:hypothetical protein
LRIGHPLEAPRTIARGDDDPGSASCAQPSGRALQHRLGGGAWAALPPRHSAFCGNCHAGRRPRPSRGSFFRTRRGGARAITQGKTTEQIAAAAGVSCETVRSQVKAVLAKTGTARQAEVAALLAGLPKRPFKQDRRLRPA